MGWNPTADAYAAACFVSECIPVVAKHEKLDEAKRKELTQFYGDEAMKLLREAVKRGYKHEKRRGPGSPARSQGLPGPHARTREGEEI